MSRIITISREFGSGGREVGKRLAEAMGIAYYDYEIIKGIADKSGLAISYVNSVVEHHMTEYYPIRIGRSFAVVNKPLPEAAVFRAQSALIRELAGKGGVFIGRCADYILRDREPVRILVYAEMESRIQRCHEKAAPGEHLSDEEMRKQIVAVDKRCSRYLGVYMYIYTGGEPLMRKKDLIALCERHPDCEFLSFTNGTLIDGEFCQEMLRIKNFVPAISLEGFEQANDGRRGTGVFKRAMRAMALLREHKLPFGISTCYTSANYEDVSSEKNSRKACFMGRR